jgi:hypothetical protein
MDLLSRRQAFKVFLDSVLGTAGTVVLATAVMPARAAGAGVSGLGTEPANDLQQRANQLAARAGNQQSCSAASNEFVNGFRNTFANGGFHNTTSTTSGGFHNGGFVNGGFHNGSTTSGGSSSSTFHNGGFVNGGFANGAFRN